MEFSAEESPQDACEASETVGKLKLRAGEHQTQIVEQARTTTEAGGAQSEHPHPSPPPSLPGADVPQVTSRDCPPGAQPRARARAYRVPVGAGRCFRGRQKGSLVSAHIYHGLVQIGYLLKLKKKLNSGMGSAPAASALWRLVRE